MRLSQIKGTLFLLGINSVYFLWEYSKYGSNLFGGKLTDGQLLSIGAMYNKASMYRSLVSLIGHLNVEHFMGNMSVLLILCAVLEQNMSSKRLVTSYFLIGLLTNILLYYVLGFDNTLSIGSSLSIYGLIGMLTIFLIAYLKTVKEIKEKKIILGIIFLMLTGSFLTTINSVNFSVNTSGHLVGFAIGCILSLFYIKIFKLKKVSFSGVLLQKIK